MKLIFVTGGIISGVGKGIAAASIGKILQQYGFSVTTVKIDPYINCDAGTLRPTEHGEVWVTDDGGEIDQDLGNYERFLGTPIPRLNNITTGQVYRELIEKERSGEFLGKTVEVIPHVPNEIKRRIREAAKKPDGGEYDFVIIEIGGTIGDYQNLPYLFAAKSFEIEMGKNSVLNVLVSYLPIPSSLGEMKTKPTQQAIRMLNETGIWPDFVLCRGVMALDEIRKRKIETYANVGIENIISAPDIKSIYEAPLNFEKDMLGSKILRRFGIDPLKSADWSDWERRVSRIKNPTHRIKVAMVGKYVDVGDFTLKDSYISINQALEHAGAELDCEVEISWIDSKTLEGDNPNFHELSRFNGLIIPGGFGSSGVEGKINAIRHMRENNIPFLGLCYGMQLAVVEFARAHGLFDAHTTEINPNTGNPVIDILASQKSLIEKSDYGGTMRLGAYAAVIDPSSKIFEIYSKTGRAAADQVQIRELMNKKDQVFRLGVLSDKDVPNSVLERHRHRYEVNPKFIEVLTQNGLTFSGFHQKEDGTRLMEFIELKGHKCFIATQGHPEFKSRLGDPSPMFLEFVRACLEK
ncbi:MAG: CTP synthase [Candidatus Aenigmatarchaeota archaeon]